MFEGIKKPEQWIVPLVLIAILMGCDKSVSPELPKATPTVKSSNLPQLSEAEIRQKYRNCPDGYYSGPQPGKTRYTKDDYSWVVSPEFAKRYCMPSNFIDAELKGALAIAYKPVQEGTEECGFGGQKEVCNRRTAHGFEIYFESATKIESLSETKFNYRAFYMLPHSKHLLSPHNFKSPTERMAWEKERPGAQSRFKHSGWGVEIAKDGRMLWPIGACGEVQYIEEILPSINYLSLECNMGNFGNPRRPQEKGMQFILGLYKLADADDSPGKALKDFAYVITLPKRLAQQVEEVDQKGAEAFQQLINRAIPKVQPK